MGFGKIKPVSKYLPPPPPPQYLVQALIIWCILSFSLQPVLYSVYITFRNYILLVVYTNDGTKEFVSNCYISLEKHTTTTSLSCIGVYARGVRNLRICVFLCDVWRVRMGLFHRSAHRLHLIHSGVKYYCRTAVWKALYRQFICFHLQSLTITKRLRYIHQMWLLTSVQHSTDFDSIFCLLEDNIVNISLTPGELVGNTSLFE